MSKGETSKQLIELVQMELFDRLKVADCVQVQMELFDRLKVANCVQVQKVC
jgi:hypothetical protein